MNKSEDFTADIGGFFGHAKAIATATLFPIFQPPLLYL